MVAAPVKLSEADKQKIAMARRAASTMFATMTGVPSEIQLEASIHLMRALFIANVKPTHRISLFNSVVQRIRQEIKEHLKTGAMP